eukprot:SAG11_NODE_34902_length_269_cov_0.982353_1_plen_53_part_10
MDVKGTSPHGSAVEAQSSATLAQQLGLAAKGKAPSGSGHCAVTTRDRGNAPVS